MIVSNTVSQNSKTTPQCICQGKVDTKNTIVLEAQFGLVLNWAFRSMTKVEMGVCAAIAVAVYFVVVLVQL